jgi:hypothetical protein
MRVGYSGVSACLPGWICRCQLVCWHHAEMPGAWLVAGRVPHRPHGVTCYPEAAAAAPRVARVGGGPVGVFAGDQLLAAATTRSAAGGLSGLVPGAGRVRAGDIRGARQRGGAVGFAQVFRCLVRHRQPPPCWCGASPVPAEAAGLGTGAVVPRHIPPGWQATEGPGRSWVPAAGCTARPGLALPRRPSAIADVAIRGRPTVGRCHRRGAGRLLPGWSGTGPRPGGRGRYGDHPRLCGGRA